MLQDVTGSIKISVYRRIISDLILIILLFGLPIVTAPLTRNVTINSLGTIGITTARPLHIEGRYIKDDLGSLVFLRGVNFGGFISDWSGGFTRIGATFYFDGWYEWDPVKVEAHLYAMKNTFGFNSLRLLVNVEDWFDNPNGYVDHIKATISLSAERGLYVIVVPWRIAGWDRGLGGHDSIPYPPYYDQLSESVGVINSRQDFIDWWAMVAGELKDYSNVLFELWNEPNPMTGETEDGWFSTVKDAIVAIRDAMADQLIIVQWGYCGSFGWVPRLKTLLETSGLDHNIVYSNHIYRYPAGATIPIGQEPTYNFIKDYLLKTPSIDNGWTGWEYQAALNASVPLIIGEIGAWVAYTGLEYQREMEYFNNTLRLLNEWNMSYMFWGWGRDTDGGWAILDGDYPWISPPNEAGQIIIDFIATGRP